MFFGVDGFDKLFHTKPRCLGFSREDIVSYGRLNILMFCLFLDVDDVVKTFFRRGFGDEVRKKSYRCYESISSFYTTEQILWLETTKVA